MREAINIDQFKTNHPPLLRADATLDERVKWHLAKGKDIDSITDECFRTRDQEICRSGNWKSLRKRIAKIVEAL